MTTNHELKNYVPDNIYREDVTNVSKCYQLCKQAFNH
jgi:hypothetical protein